MPRQLASSETSRLAYEGNFKETEKELAQNSFRTVSPELVIEQLPVPRLNLNSLIQYTDLSFQLQSLQQTELVAAYPVVASLSSRPKSLQQKELEATYSAKRSLTALLDPTRVRELELLTAQLCKEQLGETECSMRAIQLRSFQLTTAQLCSSAANSFESLQQELAVAYVFKAQYQLGQTKASELELSDAQLCLKTASGSSGTAAGKLQVAGDLCSPESIHYEPLPQTMQSYLALDVHDMYMDLRNVVQNNLAGKGSDPAEAEELRYENVFPNLTTGSVDLVVKAETSYHPKRPANNGVKGEVGSIHFRGGRNTTFLFKFVAAFIMAVWANLPFGLWPGMGMNAYFAYTIVGFKGQSNPVKKVMFAVAIEGVIFVVMSSLDIRRMVFK